MSIEAYITAAWILSKRPERVVLCEAKDLVRIRFISQARFLAPMSFPERSDGNLRLRLHKEMVLIYSAKHSKIPTAAGAAWG
jgi:hypothetical protein